MWGCAIAPAPEIEEATQARILVYTVSLLDDPAAPLQARLRALEDLEAAGRSALGPLVARWSRPPDVRFADLRTLPPGPLSPVGVTAGPTTLKQEIEALLYRIIDPEWPEPRDPRGLTPLGPYVVDWGAWLVEHRQDSLQELRTWARSARAGAWRTPAARGALSAGRLPAPRGALAPTFEAPEVQAAFLELQEGLRQGAPAQACARARALAERHPSLVRHAAHLCWRRGITPE